MQLPGDYRGILALSLSQTLAVKNLGEILHWIDDHTGHEENFIQDQLVESNLILWTRTALLWNVWGLLSQTQKIEPHSSTWGKMWGMTFDCNSKGIK